MKFLFMKLSSSSQLILGQGAPPGSSHSPKTLWSDLMVKIQRMSFSPHLICWSRESLRSQIPGQIPEPSKEQLSEGKRLHLSLPAPSPREKWVKALAIFKGHHQGLMTHLLQDRIIYFIISGLGACKRCNSKASLYLFICPSLGIFIISKKNQRKRNLP